MNQTHTLQQASQNVSENLIKPQRRSSQVADVIRTMILSGELRNGDRLPTEAQLCARYQVSRTTLRESIQMLRVKGLLDVTPGRGSYVRSPDVGNLFQDLPLMCRLDDQMAEQAVAILPSLLCQVLVQSPRFSSMHLQELSALQLSQTATDNAQRWVVWLSAMTRHTNNPVLYGLVDSLVMVMESLLEDAFKNRNLVGLMMSEQEKCINTLRSGDHMSAGKILRAMILQMMNSRAQNAVS
jgi:DNA-binding FadR family transcriptional regulator